MAGKFTKGFWVNWVQYGSLWVSDSTMDFWGKVSSLWIFGVVKCTMGFGGLVNGTRVYWDW